jgi:hypothetical protein
LNLSAISQNNIPLAEKDVKAVCHMKRKEVIVFAEQEMRIVKVI